MDQAGQLRLATVPDQLDHLCDAGVSGVFVGGTTGEWSSLSVAERISLAEAWVAAKRGPPVKSDRTGWR